MSDAVRVPAPFICYRRVATIVIASAFYCFTQNPDEQRVRSSDYHVTLTFQGYAQS
jgi:hypothetical protein